MGTLGLDDDIAALMAVLDDLGSSLDENRTGVNEVCLTADKLFGVSTPKVLGVDEQVIDAETKALADIESAVDVSLEKLSETTELLHAFSRSEMLKVLSVHGEWAEKLEAWRNKTADAAQELLRLQGVQTEIDNKFVELLTSQNSGKY